MKCKSSFCVIPPAYIGDLTHQITLKSRDIQSPIGVSVDYSEQFTIFEDVWSKVETPGRGPIFFDRTNIARQITHIFTIHYIDLVTEKIWIEYENINYDVLNIKDWNERHEFLLLYSIKRGDKSLPINQV